MKKASFLAALALSAALSLVTGAGGRVPNAPDLVDSSIGKAPARVLSSLVLNDESGLPNKEVAEMLSGRRVLPLANP